LDTSLLAFLLESDESLAEEFSFFMERLDFSFCLIIAEPDYVPYEVNSTYLIPFFTLFLSK
jgi:hypothetical protein